MYKIKDATTCLINIELHIRDPGYIRFINKLRCKTNLKIKLGWIVTFEQFFLIDFLFFFKICLT